MDRQRPGFERMGRKNTEASGNAESAAETTEKTERQKYNQEIERYSTISEKVRKSREILNAIGQKEKEITADKNAAENAEKDFAEAESALENHEKQETEWKKQSDKADGNR